MLSGCWFAAFDMGLVVMGLLLFVDVGILLFMRVWLLLCACVLGCCGFDGKRRGCTFLKNSLFDFSLYVMMCYCSSRTQIFLKLMGSLGSPWSCSLMGAAPCLLYLGSPL